MYEDWFWTAETIWENGEYIRELFDNSDELENKFREARKNGLSRFSKEKEENGLLKYNPEYNDYTKHQIGGIYGSYWATPTLELVFKDGERQMIPCYSGESEQINPNLELGCISSEVQKNIPPLKQN